MACEKSSINASDPLSPFVCLRTMRCKQPGHLCTMSTKLLLYSEWLKGLDMLQGTSVWCHYQPTDDHHILRTSERLQHPIIALSERTGVYVQDTLMLAVGFEPVVVFHHDIRRAFPPSSVVLI